MQDLLFKKLRKVLILIFFLFMTKNAGRIEPVKFVLGIFFECLKMTTLC